MNSKQGADRRPAPCRLMPDLPRMAKAAWQCSCRPSAVRLTEAGSKRLDRPLQELNTELQNLYPLAIELLVDQE